MIAYGEIEQSLREAHVAFGQNTATVSELLPCTNYSFVVAAVSKTGKMGPGALRSAETLETEGELRSCSAYIAMGRHLTGVYKFSFDDAIRVS